MTACRRSRWRRAGWNDVPWSRGTARGVPARGAARCGSRDVRTRWTASWTTRRVFTLTRSHRASATWRTRTSARCRMARSTMTGSRSVGIVSGTLTGTGSRRRWTLRCRRRTCGHRPPRTPPTIIPRTLRPASRPVRVLPLIGTNIRPPVRLATSPTTGKRRRASWNRCSGTVRATLRSSRPARRAWTARTWMSCIAIDRLALGPATVIITVSGRRRRFPIAPTLSDRVSDSSCWADRPLIRILWSDDEATWGSLRVTPRVDGDAER